MRDLWAPFPAARHIWMIWARHTETARPRKALRSLLRGALLHLWPVAHLSPEQWCPGGQTVPRLPAATAADCICAMAMQCHIVESFGEPQAMSLHLCDDWTVRYGRDESAPVRWCPHWRSAHGRPAAAPAPAPPAPRSVPVVERKGRCKALRDERCSTSHLTSNAKAVLLA